MDCHLFGTKPLYEPMIFINYTIKKKIQWNFFQNTTIFIQENLFENIICKMLAILSQSLQCVKYFTYDP